MLFATIGGFNLSQFLNQPIDEIITDLLLYLGWIPFLVIFLYGIFETWLELQRHHWRHHRPYILLAIDVPRLTEQSPRAVENIFGVTVALKASPTWLETYLMGKVPWRHSFEITSINGYIQFYIWTEQRYRDVFEAVIYAQYPDAEIALVDDYVKAVPHHYPHEQWDVWGSEYVLSKPSFMPVRTYEDFEHSLTQDLKDPLVTLFEGMAQMKPGEQLWFQVLTEHAGEAWKEEGDAFIKKTYGVGAKQAHGSGFLSTVGGALASIPNQIIGDILGVEGGHEEKDKFQEEVWKAFKVTEQEREISKTVVRKIGKPGLKTKIRVIYVARKEVFTKVTRKDMVKGFLKQLAHQDLNAFTGSGSPEDDYFWQVWWYAYYQNKLIRGYVERSTEIGAEAFVLNTAELATLWHFPTITVKVPLIKKTLAKRAEPPTDTPFADEEEEMLVAPKMVLPGGEVEKEDAPADIFEMPMAIPPSHGSARPTHTTHTKAHPSHEVATEELIAPAVIPPTAVKKLVSDRSQQTPTASAPPVASFTTLPVVPKVPTQKVSAPPAIPDAIRVLIEQGVEPEDVGVRDTIDDENGSV